MTAGGCLDEARVKLKLAGVGTGELDALVLLEHATKKDRAWLLAYPEYDLQSQTLQKFKSLIKKRVQGTPIAYLTGVKEFYELEFKVNKNVLIPRPETEAIVEQALKFGETKATMLDVGTGCGAIAIAIAKHRPAWQVDASDVSPAALVIARQNAAHHHVDIEFTQADLLEGVVKRYSLVTANLPYVKDDFELSAEGQTEPKVALRGGTDGLDYYHRLFTQLSSHLKPSSWVIIEADPWQHPELTKLAQKVGLCKLAEGRFMLAFSQPAG